VDIERSTFSSINSGPKLMDRGAEAKIYLKNNKILKLRISKSYRLNELDRRIRRHRTKKEAKIISDSRKKGVPTPIVLDLGDFYILLEYINGKKIKDDFENLSFDKYVQIGQNIGKLHSAGIVHGDLTTSNMILFNGKIYLIDFGLAEYDMHVESRGVDLHVLFQDIKSYHNKEEVIKHIKKGYSEAFEGSNKVFKRVSDISKRGRYN